VWSIIAVGGLLVSTVMVPPTMAPAVPPTVAPAAGVPSGRVTIDKLKVNGTGCRSNTTAVAVSPDNEAFTVTYSAYVAQAGAGTKHKDERKACSITVRLNVPQNLTYAVSTVDHRGYAQLGPGAAAALSARYHFQGAGAPEYSQHPFRSGLDDDWSVTDSVSGTPVFGACGKDRKLDIDTELSVQADRADAPTSLIAMDSTDGDLATRYRLVWKNCG
jgi:hypothetical protein